MSYELRHIGPAPQSFVNGGHQIRREMGFRYITGRACIKCRVDEVLILVDRQEHDFRPSFARYQMGGGLESVERRHSDIDDQYVGI